MIFAVINQKGGVGKTSTALAIAAGFTNRGMKVLSIDLDAQGNFSYSAGAKREGSTSMGVLTKEVDIDNAIQQCPIGDVIASSQALSAADKFLTETGKEFRLREGIEQLGKKYDHIIIDTPPTLGILTVNALTACDRAIIPAQADIYSIHGIEQIGMTFEAVNKYCNPNLKIIGVLLTRFNTRSVLSREIIELAESVLPNLKTSLFNTKIREAIAVKEAEIKRQDIFSYAPKSKVVEDYNSFIEELIARMEG